MELNPIAGKALMVHGGLRNSKSMTSNIDGAAWNPKSANGARWISGGTTKVLSIIQIPQYKILIKTSSGALHRERVFLIKKSLGESVRSARRPKTKVAYATVRPRIVRYCQCQP